jgi:hypothetical protein
MIHFNHQLFLWNDFDDLVDRRRYTESQANWSFNRF